MTEGRLGWIAVTVCLAMSSPVLAADPSVGATSGEVQQLQKQLEQMSKEVADMH